MKGYDPSALADWQLREATTIVIVTRDPDADNEYRAWGKEFGNGIVWCHDIDLGRADLSDPDEYDGWAESHGAIADDMEKFGWPEAAEYLRRTIDDHNPKHHD